MNYRSVLIILSLVFAPAACGPVRKDIQATIQLMRDDIRSTLTELQNREGLLPNISCVSLNYTELVNLEQLPFSAHNLSFFRCQMLKMSSQDGTPELSPWLLQLCQYAQDLEQRLINQTTNRDCNIPQFEQNMDSFIYVRCLLQLLDQKLSSAKF
ncbi:hypothetical protein D5F01_LYC09564 [Larimichthys crocea]|uniref:Uncharacterized protein n=1 Tax=Larimichthys crocea TaxID=215358 RepID=A0A6G0IKX9_LARCR|nr:hypothetical protein D5F01_LYC09564 [Larimichthys crocea]